MSSLKQFDFPELPEALRSAGADVVVRPLEFDDNKKGFFTILSQLTSAPELSQDHYMERFMAMRASKHYYTVVAEHLPTKKIVATATMMIEIKFIRGGHITGHIEDVCVDSSMRGRHLGVKLMHALQAIGKELGCYKVILDCSNDNVKFYERCGFKLKEVQMAVYFNENQARRPKL